MKQQPKEFQDLIQIKSLISLKQEELEALEKQIVDFKNIETRLFQEKSGKVFIGGQEIQPEIRDELRDEASSWKHGHLMEILSATITNEVCTSLVQGGKTMEEVHSAQALWHWKFVMENMIEKLSQ